MTNVITLRLFQHYDPDGPNPAHIYRQLPGVHKYDVQDAVMYKQDCGHFFPCIVKMQTANRYICKHNHWAFFPWMLNLDADSEQVCTNKIVQDAVMLKQDCEHISHGIFNCADTK